MVLGGRAGTGWREGVGQRVRSSGGVRRARRLSCGCGGVGARERSGERLALKLGWPRPGCRAHTHTLAHGMGHRVGKLLVTSLSFHIEVLSPGSQTLSRVTGKSLQVCTFVFAYNV